MATALQEKREKRASVWEQMKALMERSADWTAEERASYEAAEADLDKLGEEIEREERHQERAAKFDTIDRRGAVPPGGEPGERRDGGDEEADRRYAEAFKAWTRRGTSDITAEERAALRGGWVDGSELRAQGVATQSAGGYLVPPAFRAKVVEAMQYVAPMRDHAEVITTETGAALPWPTADDTANEGAILGENTQVTEQDATFGTNDIGAFMYTSKLIRVSFQLLNDNAFDVEAYIARIAGTRIGRVQNRHFTVGTGTNQPDGIVTGAPVGKVGAAGQVTTVLYDDLVDMTDSVDIAYANGQEWMLSQSARKVIRKLKDGNGRPQWEPSVQAGVPDTLLGYGIVINNNMPAPAASAKSILFGNFREAYLIRDVQGFQLLRLNERYADFLQVGFLGFQRSDGTMQNAAAVRAYQHPAA